MGLNMTSLQYRRALLKLAADNAYIALHRPNVSELTLEAARQNFDRAYETLTIFELQHPDIPPLTDPDPVPRLGRLNDDNKGMGAKPSKEAPADSVADLAKSNNI